MAIPIDSVETEKAALEIYECSCGFHMGLDATYLEQVGSLTVECPSCKDFIVAGSFDEEK